MKKLLVVESPTKARTLKKMLGREFEVLATKGHIMDLPKRALGVDIENDFKPKYVLVPNKKKLVKEIQEAAKKSKEVYIGSDPDREGEAIAYHIDQKIKEKTNIETHRVLFYEITREAVRRALNESNSIDMNKVYAQMARRILDRLVGYKVSPLLWKSVHRGLSAGRVQTVALRLVCEREREIESHVPKKFYILFVEFEKDGIKFKAKLKKWKGKKLDKIDSKEEAKRIKKSLEGKRAKVSNITKRKKRIPPLPPLKTSTLQQEASTRWGFSPKRTMMLAQRLYEGVELKEGTTGLITYMRTDSVRMAEKAIDEARNLIKGEFPKEYLPQKPRVFKEKGTVQGAHEAIRPTDFNRKPDRIELPSDLKKIYEIVWKRALASQMAEAIQEIRKVNIQIGEAEFEAEAKELVFDGFYRVMGTRPKDEKLPKLKKGEMLDLLKFQIVEKQTEPPPRYTEASLIKTLEAKGVGRPSTYAPMVSTLYERKYIVKVKNRVIKPTELGMLVYDILIPRFPNLFQVKFTAEMEKDLDKIENGEKDWKEILTSFYQWFSKLVERVSKEVKDIKKSTREETEEICPLCGSPLLIKWGRFGKFLACSNFPSCRYTRPLDQEIREDIRCPICGKPMAVRSGKGGRFFACIDYPKCKGIRPYSTGIKCPECGKGELIERRSKKGIVFFSCSNYPECKFTLSNMPVEVKCPNCGFPVLEEVKKGRVTYYRCSKCKKTFNPKAFKKEESPTDSG